MKSLKTIRIGFSLLLVVSGLMLLTAPVAAQPPDKVSVLDVKGAITPIVLSYVNRGLSTAESDGANLVIIQLDTPGGSVEIMKQLTDSMIRSEVPIVVWVGPEGARA